MSIRSFADKRTAAVFDGRVVKRVSVKLQQRARRKLNMIDAAISVEDLRIPPGNRLECLSGDRSGQFSIRVNDQWRLCFDWKDGDAVKVDFVDYHRG